MDSARTARVVTILRWLGVVIAFAWWVLVYSWVHRLGTELAVHFWFEIAPALTLFVMLLRPPNTFGVCAAWVLAAGVLAAHTSVVAFPSSRLRASDPLQFAAWPAWQIVVLMAALLAGELLESLLARWRR